MTDLNMLCKTYTDRRESLERYERLTRPAYRAAFDYRINLTGLNDADPSEFRQFAEMAYDQLGAAMSVMTAKDTDEELSQIRDEFHTLAFVDGGTVDEFDNVLQALYDWGDVDHRMWVDTDSGA